MTELNYQQLVDGYYDNLNNNLRNFKGGPGFLETWVHDEDHNRSLLEILDLAHENGISKLAIQLPQTVVAAIDVQWLSREASRYGVVELSGGRLVYSSGKSEKAQFEVKVSALYEKALQARSGALHFVGSLEFGSLSAFSAAHDGGELWVGIDSEGIVREIRHAGFKEPLNVLIDVFCEILNRRPVQEGAEHGMIRLESELRDHSQAVEVKGLVSPESIEPLFIVPNDLIRQIFAKYVSERKVDLGRNFWRDPVPAQWLDLPYEDKLKQAQSFVDESGQELGLQNDVQVIEIKNNTRFVLSYTQDKAKPDVGRNMIKMERGLKAKTGFEIELQLESVEDRNKRKMRSKI